MKPIVCLFFLIITGLCFSQNGKTTAKDISVSPYIDGTILLPDGVENPKLAIIIGGSGPTDRNGNQQMMNTNSLKYLAEGLSANGIATFRYDKRIIKLELYHVHS